MPRTLKTFKLTEPDFFHHERRLKYRELKRESNSSNKAKTSEY
jgi:hypothetical protein